MTPPTPVTVGPSPVKVLGNVAVASVAATAGIAVLVVFLGCLVTPLLLVYAWAIVACTAALAACFCGVAVLGATFAGRPRVEIGPEGFVARGVIGCRSRRRSDIEGNFVVVRSGLQSVVAYRLTDAFKESARGRPGTSPGGNDEAITFCGELAVGAGELAELLNRWQRGLQQEVGQ